MERPLLDFYDELINKSSWRSVWKPVEPLPLFGARTEFQIHTSTEPGLWSG